MSEKEDLAKQKAEAAAKAKAVALARKQAKEEAAEKPEGEMDIAKQKAAAAAKAKAAALANKQAKEETAEKPEGEMDIAKQKAEAAAKAKAAALARKQAKEETAEKPEGEMDIAKQKAEAAAKAKAAALAKKQAKAAAEKPEGEMDIAKQKAAAAAKAKATALARKQAKEETAKKPEGEMDIAKQKAAAAAKAKAAAAAKAKAAAAAKNRTAVQESEEVDTPSEISPNQSKLDQIVSAIESHVGQGALLENYINRLSKDVPTLVANPDTYFSIAKFLRYDEQLDFSYLSELHGSDFESHMEIYVHLHSFKMNQSVALKVKLDRDTPVIPSLVPLWSGANWPECEAYDLLGINFYEHPDLKRILLGEDWKGYPLRKDYEPYDVEV
ncbi:NADH-quinone oxidoreductase subunit C [Peribacillus frigoritolerans]|uniref:NADH-quinone oxidoreductase subunit C n=1 Tax=Peribacillus frigoritolerans TaxID=450367 RepID=UPI002B24FCF8|nr:NADH-quinone oxidoreductase subunit C [Peribacillus frigoritolerans]MEB2627194.1 NADH-quinone oxidoreductase subunit C [Peribacillus frigoritolerans]